MSEHLLFLLFIVLIPCLIPFDLPDKTKEPETLIFQAILALYEQGMRESNSHQRFWRPLSYHLTNPLYRGLSSASHLYSIL